MAADPLRIPSEIEFKVGKDDTTSVTGFKIENTSKESVCFKIKTTAPKRYSVRPNVGILNPGEISQVRVTLNLAKDPKRDSDAIDKFQVLSIIIPADQKAPKPEDDNYSDFIKNLWTASTTVFKERIKVLISKKSDIEKNSSNSLSTTASKELSSSRQSNSTPMENTRTRADAFTANTENSRNPSVSAVENPRNPSASTETNISKRDRSQSPPIVDPNDSRDNSLNSFGSIKSERSRSPPVSRSSPYDVDFRENSRNTPNSFGSPKRERSRSPPISRTGADFRENPRNSFETSNKRDASRSPVSRTAALPVTDRRENPRNSTFESSSKRDSSRSPTSRPAGYTERNLRTSTVTSKQRESSQSPTPTPNPRPPDRPTPNTNSKPESSRSPSTRLRESNTERPPTTLPSQSPSYRGAPQPGPDRRRQASRSEEDRGRSGFDRGGSGRDPKRDWRDRSPSSSMEDNRYLSVSRSRSPPQVKNNSTRERLGNSNSKTDYESRADVLMAIKAQSAEIKERLAQAERQKLIAFMLVAFLVGIIFSKWILK